MALHAGKGICLTSVQNNWLVDNFFDLAQNKWKWCMNAFSIVFGISHTRLTRIKRELTSSESDLPAKSSQTRQGTRRAAAAAVQAAIEFAQSSLLIDSFSRTLFMPKGVSSWRGFYSYYKSSLLQMPVDLKHGESKGSDAIISRHTFQKYVKEAFSDSTIQGYPSDPSISCRLIPITTFMTSSNEKDEDSEDSGVDISAAGVQSSESVITFKSESSPFSPVPQCQPPTTFISSEGSGLGSTLFGTSCDFPMQQDSIPAISVGEHDSSSLHGGYYCSTQVKDEENSVEDMLSFPSTTDKSLQKPDHPVSSMSAYFGVDGSDGHISHDNAQFTSNPPLAPSTDSAFRPSRASPPSTSHGLFSTYFDRDSSTIKSSNRLLVPNFLFPLPPIPLPSSTGMSCNPVHSALIGDPLDTTLGFGKMFSPSSVYHMPALPSHHLSGEQSIHGYGGQGSVQSGMELEAPRYGW
eukprot:gnl/Carplike_NY0171/2285_a3080_769.p1 GENE.gnl/Carplike_NY0171/2285_a3080_769~~gnl/Carplike_NY0171/2285_a3080_769.p1  ORF type:complete len:515 (-),score=108.76 gnl/Carplike_NY0171/2285_a3080_769:115-1506(-)